jgi:hypothetical protein
LFPKTAQILVRTVVGPRKVLIIIEIVEPCHTSERLSPIVASWKADVLASIKQKMEWQSRRPTRERLAISSRQA